MEYPAVIALGSTSIDAENIFRQAVELLTAGGVADAVLSSRIRTKPLDCVPGTPDFTNAVLTGLWRGSAQELLQLTQSIERAMGRPAVHSSREGRTLDLDIILLGNLVLETPELVIPHPRAKLRSFVLKPLAELSPDLRFPSGESVTELLEKLEN